MFFFKDDTADDGEIIVNFPMPKPVGASYKFPLEIREAARQRMIKLLEDLQ